MSLTSTKTGYTVGGLTSSTGMATWLDWIPNEIGKLATLVGIFVSLIVIVAHVRKMRQESRESEQRVREGRLREQLLWEQLEREREKGA